MNSSCHPPAIHYPRPRIMSLPGPLSESVPATRLVGAALLAVPARLNFLRIESSSSPALWSGKDNFQDKNEIGPKLIIAMVGLPARGKSYIVRRLKRYLSWLGFHTKVFNVGNRRRVVAQSEVEESGHRPDHFSNYFDPDNVHAKQQREQLAMDSLEEIIMWLRDGGKVGIHDATNSTYARRQAIIDRVCQEPGISIMFLESVCDDPLILARNMRLKLSGPDYVGIAPEKALADFQQRVHNYERAYEAIDEREERAGVQYCKLIDVGRKVITHGINGYLVGQVVFYLMNLNLARRQVFLSRHGESTDNVLGRIGGDSPLTLRGKKYAAALTKFVGEQRKHFRAKLEEECHRQMADLGLRICQSADRPAAHASTISDNFLILTSRMQRTVQTIEHFDPSEYDIQHVRVLNEICAGIFEGMTYEEIRRTAPAEFAARQADKLQYRYPGPGGESYLDVIERLQPILVELERTHDSYLIVSHRVVARTLLAYVLDLPSHIMTRFDVPLHTVYCVEPMPFGYELRQWRYLDELDEFELVENDIQMGQT